MLFPAPSHPNATGAPAPDPTSPTGGSFATIAALGASAYFVNAVSSSPTPSRGRVWRSRCAYGEVVT